MSDIPASSGGASPDDRSDLHSGTGAGRYAPSPTGELHLGNLRTALLAWLFARSSGRRFLLRIEDLDAPRVRPGTADKQRADLTTLGITFDGEPVVQSQRLASYHEALLTLADRTYECFCTRREIAQAASAPHGPVARYPGICRDLTEAERIDRRRTRVPALRLRADGATHTVHDLLHGDITAEVDDVVLRRNDGVPAYNLAVVVDDAFSGIDQVVRGEDLLQAAATQAYLATLLGYRPPVYAHVPLAVNGVGGRLAKRDGAVTLSELAVEGIEPPAVLDLIAESLDLAAAGEHVTLGVMLERFDPGRLPRNPWVVIAEKFTRAAKLRRAARLNLNARSQLE